MAANAPSHMKMESQPHISFFQVSSLKSGCKLGELKRLKSQWWASSRVEIKTSLNEELEWAKKRKMATSISSIEKRKGAHSVFPFIVSHRYANQVSNQVLSFVCYDYDYTLNPLSKQFCFLFYVIPVNLLFHWHKKSFAFDLVWIG